MTAPTLTWVAGSFTKRGFSLALGGPIFQLLPRSHLTADAPHVLPKGLHRIRHYGLFARGSCADNIARARTARHIAPHLERCLTQL